MKTQILKPTKENITKAAKEIRLGNIVAFPTETVYGLGANALNKDAVEKIFKAKGRPSDNPLIVHIENINQLKQLAKQIPKKAIILTQKFWPGPLTIVLKKKSIVPDITTANKDTVGIRMPKNKIALKLIKESNCPIAAPSANSFSKPSPTLPYHVYEDLKNKLEIILDGKQCSIGVESTIIDLTKNPPLLLRPGKITIEQIEKTIGKIELHESILNPQKKVIDALAPGMKYKHYSPKAKVILYQELPKIIPKTDGIITYKTKLNKPNEIHFKNKQEYAKGIFKAFRDFDNKKIKTIHVKIVEEKGLGIGILNRIKKASTNKI
ncbi:threonylcarbamoyl-AMP synthase [Candidatus Woesearchaeota archaeon]|nr:threonylcarbamoyl-AMP synthase [Candidatus Woesearchaeota archaeon]